MPRHSQNTSGRRNNSSRPPGGPRPGKQTTARKTAGEKPTGGSAKNFRKTAGGSPKTFRKTTEGSAKRFGKTTEGSAKSFGKASGGSGKAFGRTSGGSGKNFSKTARPTAETPGKSFSQKSRFAKRRSDTPGEKGRGESYGKPFKRPYRAKPAKSHASPPHRRHLKEALPAGKSENVRLNKFIANSGISSRREADELIKMGLISVNGKIVSELGYKVAPGDEVRYEDKLLRAEKPVYVLLNKPKGFITTTEDPQDRKTVMHIIGPTVKERIYPVGRLDRNTTGLLLLTNDGDLADKLMHPSFNVKKVYKVELDKPLSKNDFQKIVDGVRLEEGRVAVDDLAIVSEDARTVGVELHIGWNRVVRRIFESLGYEVMRLDRTAYAGLDKKDLARGQWRFLTKQEIIHLKHFK